MKAKRFLTHILFIGLVIAVAGRVGLVLANGLGFCATVGGGYFNTASGDYATVSGGSRNNASSYNATVGGGESNTASNPYATVGGGSENEATAWYATVGGGYSNEASGLFPYAATVGGGYDNTASGYIATVGGGKSNTASSYYATVSGGRGNEASARYATVGGGGTSDATDPATGNRVTDDYGTVGGGGNNQAGNANDDLDDADYGTVGGGRSNEAGARYATVGGGLRNTASNPYATVGGGLDNTASGLYATVGGGSGNTAQGQYSFAAGQRAKANHYGAFVWGDGVRADINSSSSNQFIVRANGGIWFGQATSDFTPTIGAGRFINTSTGAYLSTGGAWTDASDRALKENFTSVDGQEVLARLAGIPITTWNYKAQHPSTRHMGPVGQDFYAAFGLGEDDRHIASLDADGVALAAIQGLYQLSREQAARIEAMEAENAALEQRLDDLEARVAALEQVVAPRPVESGLLPGAGPSATLGVGVLLAGLGLALSLPKGLVWVTRGKVGDETGSDSPGPGRPPPDGRRRPSQREP